MIKTLLSQTILAAAVVGALALAIPVAATAHHSAAMYDGAKVATVNGTIKEFHWTNPHVIVTVTGKDATGVEGSWNIECSALSILVRNGWSSKVLTPGDKVQIQMRPMRDGGKAGLMLTVAASNGVMLKDHGGVSAPAMREEKTF